MDDKPAKTVFVLGAGASAASDFHLPVMKGFMTQLDHHDYRVHNLCRYCDQTFPFSYEPGHLHGEYAGLNLEEVFTQLELDLAGFASIRGWSVEELLAARGELLAYVESALDLERYARPDGCAMHKQLLSETFKEDSLSSILTLNYDMVVDVTMNAACRDQKDKPLWRMYSLLGVLPGFFQVSRPTSRTKPQKGLFLKLHGSVDWAFCPNPNCMHHENIGASWLGLGNRPTKAGDICASCGTDFEPVIVPPTMKKSFEQFPKLGLIWRLAHEELKVADKVVFFGVSMAESDYYLHWLIRSSLVYRDPKPEVIVINPCNEALDRTRKLTGIFPRHYESVEQYLDERDA